MVVLTDAMETGHFEAINQFGRPATWRGWLDFALLDLGSYLVAGIVGALLGFVASFTRPNKQRSAGCDGHHILWQRSRQFSRVP
jgi:hypothetical protein